MFITIRTQQFIALFTIGTAIFDVYCLAMAAPGSTHYGYFIISYEFVYVGNPNVRNGLMIFALFSLLTGVVILYTSVLLVIALRKEYEHKILPWLWSFAVFTIVRLLAFLFFSIVNDMIFAYNILMVVVWTLLLIGCAYSWLVIYSLYLELSDLTKLEDLAHLRVSWGGNETAVFVCAVMLIFRSSVSGWCRWERWHPSTVQRHRRLSAPDRPLRTRASIPHRSIEHQHFAEKRQHLPRIIAESYSSTAIHDMIFQTKSVQILHIHIILKNTYRNPSCL